MSEVQIGYQTWGLLDGWGGGEDGEGEGTHAFYGIPAFDR
jgi:hypothetical protein